MGRYYTGITALEPEKRLQRHNKGDVYSTRFEKPWTLIYIEKFDSLAKARAFEKRIKSWKSGNAFKKFLTRVAGSSNGRTSPFGGDYERSNRSPAALSRK